MPTQKGVFVPVSLKQNFSLISLADNKEGNFFGASDEMALVVYRHEGEVIEEDSDRSKWKGKYICKQHLNELSWNFNNRVFGHRKFNKKNNILLCGFPEKSHSSTAVEGLELTYHQSIYLLENRHFLLLPGTRKIK